MCLTGDPQLISSSETATTEALPGEFFAPPACRTRMPRILQGVGRIDQSVLHCMLLHELLLQTHILLQNAFATAGG